jgi:K+-transporting ATPase KdpF subunit
MMILGQVEEHQMEFIVAGIVALLLLAYLSYAMFNPEKFE